MTLSLRHASAGYTFLSHYHYVIMGAIASQITSLTIVYSFVYSDVDQRKHQSSASLAFVRGIHRGPLNSPHKWPVMRKMFPFDDVIMLQGRMKALAMTSFRSMHCTGMLHPCCTRSRAVPITFFVFAQLAIGHKFGSGVANRSPIKSLQTHHAKQKWTNLPFQEHRCIFYSTLSNQVLNQL